MLLTEYIINSLILYKAPHFINPFCISYHTLSSPVFDSAPSLDEVQWFCSRYIE